MAASWLLLNWEPASQGRHSVQRRLGFVPQPEQQNAHSPRCQGEDRVEAECLRVQSNGTELQIAFAKDRGYWNKGKPCSKEARATGP